MDYKWYRHGSHDSLDEDVYYVIDEIPKDRKTADDIIKQNKNQNVNLIKIDDGIVSYCHFGTIDEVNNGLITTYPLHYQKYPLEITRYVERDVLLKLIRVVRCYISYLSRTKYGKEAKTVLKSYSFQNRISFLKSVNFEEILDFEKKDIKEVYKILTFQLAQIKGLFEDLELYTKEDCVDYIPNIKPHIYRLDGASSSVIEECKKNLVELCQDLYFEDELYYTTFFYKIYKRFDLRNEYYLG